LISSGPNAAGLHDYDSALRADLEESMLVEALGDAGTGLRAVYLNGSIADPCGGLFDARWNRFFRRRISERTRLSLQRF
jgi:hypothetical protein